MELIIIGILILIAGLTSAFFVYRWKKSKVDQEQTRTNQEQTEAIRDLERRLTDLMTNQLKEIRGNVDGTSKAMYQQVSSFTKETVQIREEIKQMQESMKGISSFQEFFQSPKIRGQWGEASLEHILGEYFPSELYKTQHLFSSGEQVDAILKLPNGKMLPIDAKFPFDNFRKMVGAENKEDKDTFFKKFVDDVKLRIQEITSKYIQPSEDTVDFAIMYIPAEAVYYEINMQKDVDLGDYARSKKVILASPNTIYLTLRTIEHWFKDTQISRQTQQILKRLMRIQKDGRKLTESFRKLGSHLRSATSAYGDSEKRVSLFGERVERLLDSSDEKKLSNETKKLKE